LVENYLNKPRVDKVFNKVRRAANKPISPALKIVNGKIRDPFMAFTLPTGEIVLSEGVIELCYFGVSKEHGDARLAFILGHELAHVANGDALPKAFLNCPEYQEVQQKYRKTGQEKERRADKQGVLYAAMAGYAVDDLLWEKDGDFFITWQQETDGNWQPNSTHPAAETRAKDLYDRLKKSLDLLPYFQFGVRLSHFNRCDEAVDFLKEFSTDFPAREVFNNLGLCELQRARQELGKEAAYAYWLPSVLDVTTQIDGFSLPSVPKGEEMSPLAKRLLINAKVYFNKALKMEPSYLPANVNLAITALYLEENVKARAAIKNAYRLAPNDLEIQGLHALIKYQDKQPNKAIQALEQLAQKPNVPLSVFYNRAQLLEQHGRSGADDIWQQLARQAAKLPAPIRHLVCEKTACAVQRKQSPKATWVLPVKLGVRTRRSKTLARWQKSPKVRLYDIYEQIYRQNDTAEVLALRGRVAMVVLKKFERLTQEDLSAYCGQPLRQRSVVSGTIFSCHDYWAALVVDEKVKEVWIVKSN
jgi:tetratricopeptide (TPR) repeat protein